MELKRLNIGLREKANIEAGIAQAEKNEATLAYIALMSGVELPEENTTNGGTSNEQEL